MDRHGLTVVRTPLAEAKYAGRGYKPFIRSDIEYFQPQVGMGQGDVPSPLNWVAFFDILLSALRLIDSDFYIRSGDVELSPIGEMAYADDLMSGAASLQGLQAKADIVSAFSIFMGLDLAIQKKLRVAALLWSPDMDRIGRPDSLSIVVHTVGWTPNLVSLQTDGHITYLGVDHSLYGNGTTQLHTSKQMVKRYTSIIMARKATPMLKIAALTACLLPIFYTMLRCSAGQILKPAK